MKNITTSKTHFFPIIKKCKKCGQSHQEFIAIKIHYPKHPNPLVF